MYFVERVLKEALHVLAFVITFLNQKLVKFQLVDF